MSSDQHSAGVFVAQWLVVLVLALTFMWSPYSPLALRSAQLAYNGGSVLNAALMYDRAAEYNPSRAIRDEARYRAALIWGAELQNSAQSLSRFRQLLSEHPDSAFAASAWQQIAQILAERKSGLRESAQALCLSYQADPGHLLAAGRLISCADRFADSGAYKLADREWRRLFNTFPNERARALLGRANLKLRDNSAKLALELFERAAQEAQRPEERLVASLGVSSCLERLGDVEEALAELNLVDLPFNVMDRRRRVLRARKMDGDFWTVQRPARP